MPDNTFDLILFDLGGVLIELGGVDQMQSWMDGCLSAADMWRRWLSSDTVRAFESGQTDPQHFAAAMIDEFNLPLSAGRFLKEFNRWLKCLYPGATDLLTHLSSHYSLGLLSNTNEVHWQRIVGEMDIISYFDWVMPSHQTGHLKPDANAFLHVLNTTGHPANRILFIDDNRLNTNAARKVGIHSKCVSGVAGVMKIVDDLNLLGDVEIPVNLH